jgi:hypothetical protein
MSYQLSPFAEHLLRIIERDNSPLPILDVPEYEEEEEEDE